MPIGPLRRTLGVLGLVMLIPVAWMVAVGSLSVADAATRAAVTVAAIAGIGRITTFGVDRMAASFERASAPGRATGPFGPSDERRERVITGAD